MHAITMSGPGGPEVMSWTKVADPTPGPGEVIIDIQPANVVYTTFPHYARDTKLLLLHEKKLVDASVLYWVGAFEYDEGSRHMISVKPRECKTGSQVW